MKEQDDLLLERYINGELEKEAQQVFEERLQQEVELSEAYELRLQMQQFLVEKQKKEEFSTFLKGVSADYFAETQQESAKVIPLWKKRPFIITSITLAAAVALFLIFPFLQPKDLYEQFNDHQTLALVEQSDDNIAALQTAEAAFNSNDYAQALSAFNEYLEQKPTDLQAQLYKSICLIEIDQLSAARAILQPIAQGNSAFKSEGLWYMALSFLKSENYTQSKEYLELLMVEGQDKELTKKAERLYSKLEDS